MKEFTIRRDGEARVLGPGPARANFDATLAIAVREKARLVFFATQVDGKGDSVVGASFSMNEYDCLEVWRAMAVAMLRDGRVNGLRLEVTLAEAIDHVADTGG